LSLRRIADLGLKNPTMGGWCKMNNNADYDALSIQKMNQHEKISSPHAIRLKEVRAHFARQRGVENVSQARFAAFLGVHTSKVSHIEAGTTRIQADFARLIEEKTGFSQAWLLVGVSPERVSDRYVPPPGEAERRSEFCYIKKVKPLLSGGAGELVTDESSEDYYSFRIDWLTRKGQISAMRLAQVSGDSMEPTLRDGDFVLFDISKQYPVEGKIMVVGIDNLLYIKRLRRMPEGTWALVSDNKALYEPWKINPDEVRFLGLVIWRCGEI
jgi:phage repressor protein C with HTH and peptisase S24 domain